jgi:hypothetical protein
MKNKYAPVAFFVFGLVCAIFGFITEVEGQIFIIPSSFYLQLATVSMLAAIYFEFTKKN